MTTPDVDIQAFLRKHLDGLTPLGSPEPLSGGMLNVLWRIPADPDAIVVKYAPPYIAADPDSPLDPSRLTFEFRALDIFDVGGELASLGLSTVRPPRPLAFDASIPMLAMEDCGDWPHLGDRLQRGDEAVALDRGDGEVAWDLGRCLGRLHRRTLDDAEIAARFDNSPIQEMRRDMQYASVGALLERADVERADELGERAAELGERLTQPGRCLTMGDLWPRSLLVDGDRDLLRLIDWEFAHYGDPIQDVAHLAAHLWMHAHCGDAGTRRRTRAWGEGFWRGYADAVASVRDDLLSSSAARDASLHVGAEILVRTVGPFREDYLYEDCLPEGQKVREAVSAAVDFMTNPPSLEALCMGAFDSLPDP